MGGVAVDSARLRMDDMTTDRVTKLTVRVDEAAALLEIGRTLAYEAIRRGQIPCVRVGRRVLVPLAAIEKLLADSETK